MRPPSPFLRERGLLRMVLAPPSLPTISHSLQEEGTWSEILRPEILRSEHSNPVEVLELEELMRPPSPFLRARELLRIALAPPPLSITLNLLQEEGLRS